LGLENYRKKFNILSTLFSVSGNYSQILLLGFFPLNYQRNIDYELLPVGRQGVPDSGRGDLGRLGKSFGR
jgi:hypothetical protein